MADRLQIASSDVAKILALQEDYYVDFKSKDAKPASLSKWMSAFANSSGGDIYVGVSEVEKGWFEWAGFDRIEDANAHLAVLSPIFPAGDDFRYAFLEAAGYSGAVLRIEVSKTQIIKESSSGEIYRRVGAQIKRVESSADLEVLKRQKGIVTHEVETIGAPLELVTDSYQILEFLVSVIPSIDSAGPWLKKQLLIREGNPTVAAVVLFADEPQVALPKASVIVYRYATSNPVGSREFLVDGKTHLIEGSAYRQIADSVSLVTSLIEQIKSATLERVEYPNETLHEIVTNAVIHRDYSVQDNVHIRIFDDRVEVESPGRLSGHVTPMNILDARFSRNQQIERWLHKFPDPPNKNVGEGLRTAFAAMKKMRLKDPEIYERNNSVLVIIRHEKLDSPATLIVEFLKVGGTITNRQARDATGIPQEGEIRRVFTKLIAKGEIERVPGTFKGGAKYRLIGTDFT